MTGKEKPKPELQAARFSWGMILPLAFFTGLAALFFFGLQTGDPSKLPSALLGKPAPEFELPPLEGLKENGTQVPGFARADLAKGEVSIMNVWASWCVPCRAEHPFLTQIARQSGAPLFGLNYKDPTEAARRFLGHYGNPFKAVGVDATGRTAIEWGVYGVPETFIVSKDGRILYKHVGPINADIIEKTLLPEIIKARNGS